MQDSAGQSLLGVRSAHWTPFGNPPVCVILAKDVNPFVCSPKLDGDRRFEIRFQRKFTLKSPAYSLDYRFVCAQRFKRSDGSRWSGHPG